MKARGVLFILLGAAVLAAAQTGASQSSNPSYRPPPSSPAQSTPSYRPPSRAPAGSSAGAPTSGQCGAGTSTPTGATSFASGTGKVPASGGGKQAYSQTPLNLANYSVGGQLTIQARVSGGSGSATLELFPANTTFAADGTPSAQALTTQTVATGGCATLTYNFSQGANYILAVTGGSSGAPGGATFQYSASVAPSFAGVFSPVTGTQPPTLATPAPAQSAPATASAPPTAAQPTGAVAAPTEGASTQPTPIQNPNASSPNTPLMIQSVTIQNSPGVPDTGGHCIICGLVTGNLTAVEPNLVICVTATGRTGAARSCTGICNPGHDCNAPLESRVMLLASSHTVHVEVLDNDKEGKITPLAAFDENDAAQCTTDQPCKVDDADDQAAGTLVSFGFGGPEGCETSAAVREAGPVLLASTMIVPGLLPAQTSTPRAQSGCDITFTSYSGAITSQQLYEAFMSLYRGSNLFQARMNTARGQVKMGAKINVVVVSSGSPQYNTLSKLGVAGFANYNKNNEAASQSDQASGAGPGNQKSVQDLFAFTLPPDPKGNIDVVISETALTYGYYPMVDTGFFNTLATKIWAEPIQMVLAYELGSNVVGLAANKNFQESPYQTFTNCMMEQAFPGFVANGNNVPKGERIGTDIIGQATYTYVAMTASPEEVTSFKTLKTGTDAKGQPIYKTYGVSKSGLLGSHGVWNAVTGQAFPGSSLTNPVTYHFNGQPGDPVGLLSFCKKPTGAQPPDPTSCPDQQVPNGLQPEVGPPTCDGLSDPVLADLKSGTFQLNSSSDQGSTSEPIHPISLNPQENK